MSSNRYTRTCAVLLAFVAGTTTAQAQTPPPGVQPGAVERQFQPTPQPRATPLPIQLPAVQQRAPAEADALRFGVKRIELEGATALPADTVRALLAPLEGRDITLAELVTAANRLTATYRNEGYILAQVVVPQQRIEPTDALVRLQAVEGHVDAVRFSGDTAVNNSREDQRLAAVAEAIRGARPLTAATLERYLLLLNDIPGLKAATTLTPSPTQPGAADLEVRLSRSTLSGEVSIDNRGSRAVGPWRATVDIEAAGLTGASRSGLRVAGTGDSQLVLAQLKHEQTLGSEGTRVVLNAGLARSRPELPASFGSLAFETASRSLGVSVQHPLVRSRSLNLYARAGITMYDGEAQTNGERTSEDRIRALRLGLTWDRADAWQGLNVIDVEYARGLSALGASPVDDPLRSRAAGRPEFSKFTVYAARLQSVARRWSVLAAASAQLARTDLLAPELFAVGAEPFGRGYDPSELVGDHGAALKFELRYSGSTDLGWLPSYTLYAFHDAAVVRRRTPVNESGQASLASAGIGLRFGAEAGVSGFVEIAKPLTRLVASRGDRDARPHAGLAAKF
jgi:hemolysin activation/secretion protein